MLTRKAIVLGLTGKVGYGAPMKTFFSRLALAALLVAPLFSSPAHARVQIDLSAPGAAPIPTAVPAFYGATPEAARFAADLASVVRNNFSNSTPFKVVNPSAYLQTPAQIASQGVAFADWKGLNTDALLTGTVTQEGSQLKVEYRLFDINTEQQLAGKRYTVDPQFWRHIAHRISDDVYKELTGEEGYFATRVVHIGESRDVAGKRQQKLCVMDQDSANYQCLTDGSPALVLSPRFNPNLQKIIYMSYANGMPRLYFPGYAYRPANHHWRLSKG